MTTERIVRIVAGLMILLTLALAHFSGTVDMTQMNWLWLTAFVGLNLFQSGFTRFCPLDNVCEKLGARRAQ